MSSENSETKSKRKLDPRTLLLIICSLLIFYGIFGLLKRWLSTHGTDHPPTISQNAVIPSEKPVSDNYSVPPDQPKQIVLPSINAKGYIQKVDLTKDGAVGSPDNVLMAGWYDRSIKPGNVGLSIIDGHVQGYYRPGIFKQLANLKQNDNFTVVYGDNSVRKFQVVSVNNIDENKAAQALFAKNSAIKQQLNLITCSGKFDKAQNEYLQRTIVVAKLVS